MPKFPDSDPVWRDFSLEKWLSRNPCDPAKEHDSSHSNRCATEVRANVNFLEEGD